MVEAANLIGSTQIQGRATHGRQSLQRLARRRQRARPGRRRRHASIAGPNGKRTVPVEKIGVGPGKTSLEEGRDRRGRSCCRKRPPRSGDAYLRFIPRTEMDIAVVGVGVSLTLDAKGVCTAARVALGAVRRRCCWCRGGRQALIGSTVDEAALERLAAAASAACRPIDDKRGTKAFRIKVAGVLARAGGGDGIAAREGEMMSEVQVSTTINGDAVEFLCEPHETLLDVLRDRLGLTGSQGRLRHRRLRRLQRDARRPRSSAPAWCSAPRPRAARSTPSKASPHGDELHPLQQQVPRARRRCNAASARRASSSPPRRCSTSNPDPTETEIRFWLAGNLCRCTGYDKIVRAVQAAASEMRKG